MWVRCVALWLVLGLTWGFQTSFLSAKLKSRLAFVAGSSSNPENDRSIQNPPSLSGDSTNNPSGNSALSTRSTRIQHRDVVIVGSGLAGLSVALYLTQMDPDRHVTILERERPENRQKVTTVASFAAAGMLAPQSERLPKGHLLDLCMASRRMYPDFCDLVETLAKESGEEGERYLFTDSNDDDDLEPWNVGYVASGGFLAPAFAGDSVATWAPPQQDSSRWLDATQVRELEPNLHPDVVGGWWLPEDASVDSIRLTCSLRAACVAAGVQILSGPEYEVTSLDLSDGTCRGLWLQNGRYMQAKSLLVANGAWMRNLLPVPIEPHKGQSLSLRMPADQPPLLRRVLFAQDTYIVPKADGRIVVGATVEAGSYDPNVTPAGLLHILTHAMQLVPTLKDLAVEDTWVGLRPTTPDKGPILGKTPWDNLFLAGGYWRNGVLLAPKTGQLLAALMSDLPLSVNDQELLSAFAWDRFTRPGTTLAASARYAASMHPIHTRKSGVGVAASVGTELGVYSTARAASPERQQERKSLLDDDDNDDQEAAFERAAAMGKEDASAFSFGDIEKPAKKHNQAATAKTSTYEGSADAYTVGSASTEIESSSTTQEKGNEKPNLLEPVSSSQQELETKQQNDVLADLNAAYEKIQKNQASRTTTKLDPATDDDERPDPGFRIFHVDPVTREKREVPPYTSPGEFLASLETEGKEGSKEKELAAKDLAASLPAATVNGESTSNYNEKMYDGYQAIQESNSRRTRQEELEAMRKARQKNRLGQSSIDLNQIGARRAEDEEEEEDDDP